MPDQIQVFLVLAVDMGSVVDGGVGLYPLLFALEWNAQWEVEDGAQS